MNWLTRLLGNRPELESLDAKVRDAITHWQALPPPDLGRPHFETRYVILNTEATGLDLDQDKLLAVGAIGLDGALLSPRDSYYAKLEPDPAKALADLLTFTGNEPVVVFNASFNRTQIERALAEHLGVEPDWCWLDLYWLLPSLFDDYIDRPARLGEWMKVFGIETFQRHHALGDAWAIAQLMLAVQSRALQANTSTARSLADLERNRRQLSRQP